MATRYPPALLTTTYAANGDKTVPPATAAGAGAGRFSQALGFPPITSKSIIEGGKPPTREDFNGAFYQLSTFAIWFQQGGVMHYEPSLTYEVGNEVLQDNVKYRCIKAGKGHQPPNATYWKNVDAPTGMVLSVNGQAPDAAGNVEIETGIPVATASVLGGVKVGSNLSITSAGVLSADPTVTQTASAANQELPLLAKNSNGTTTVTDTAKFKQGVTLNPSLGRISASILKGNFTGDAGSSTATTQAAGDNSNRLATTAFVKSALQNFLEVTESGENYVRFSNGLQLVWTSLTRATDGKTGTWIFPAAFSNATYAALIGNVTGATDRNNESVTNKTRTSIDYDIAEERGIDVLCIGWWRGYEDSGSGGGESGGGTITPLSLSASYYSQNLTEGVDEIVFSANWGGGVAPYTLKVNGTTKYSGSDLRFNDSWAENTAPGVPRTVLLTDSAGSTATYIINSNDNDQDGNTNGY